MQKWMVPSIIGTEPKDYQYEKTIWNEVCHIFKSLYKTTEIKGIQTEKANVKLSLFTDGKILYIRNCKKITKQLLD